MCKMIIVFVVLVVFIVLVLVVYVVDVIDLVLQVLFVLVLVLVVGNWVGGYVGVIGFWNWGQIKNFGYVNVFGFGGYGGYNFQDGQLVYGVEGNVDYNGVQCIIVGIKIEIGVQGVLCVCVGVDMNFFMFYGVVGVVVGSVKVFDGVGNNDMCGVIGWIVGVGVEMKVMDNVMVCVEYDFMLFGNCIYVFGGINVLCGYDQNVVKVGIGYKF